jgi:hypothetical protein
MWFRKNKTEPAKNLLHGVDIDLWDYLGSTEIKFDKIPFIVYYFWKKGDDDVRQYVVGGSDKSSIAFVKGNHRYIYHTCELWRIAETEIYVPIREPSKWLNEYMFNQHGHKWDKEKNWWVLATDQDRYEHSVAQHQKKHPEIYTADNIVTVNFKKE